MEFGLTLHLSLSCCLDSGPELSDSPGKQVPTTELSFLKHLVDARSSVACVCDVWMPLAIFSHLRGVLEPFQPAYIELRI